MALKSLNLVGWLQPVRWESGPRDLQPPAQTDTLTSQSQSIVNMMSCSGTRKKIDNTQYVDLVTSRTHRLFVSCRSNFHPPPESKTCISFDSSFLLKCVNLLSIGPPRADPSVSGGSIQPDRRCGPDLMGPGQTHQVHPYSIIFFITVPQTVFKTSVLPPVVIADIMRRSKVLKPSWEPKVSSRPPRFFLKSLMLQTSRSAFSITDHREASQRSQKLLSDIWNWIVWVQTPCPV